MATKALLAILTLAFVACHAKESHTPHQTEVKEIKISEMGTDIQVPTEIWNSLQSVQHKGAAEGATEEKGAGSIAVGSVDFLPVKVRLKEKNPGVLIAPEILIDFPRGGGEIDLAQMVTDRNGTFYLSFEFEPDSDSEKFDVFYVSRARKRKIDGEVWGVGCNKYLNIKSYYLNTIKKNGFSLNTTRNRHVSAVAGHFILASKTERQIYVAQVTFKDSRNFHLLCGAKVESDD